MSLQKLELKVDEPVYFQVSDPTALLVCKSLKCDTKVKLSVSLDKEEWVEIEPTKNRYLTFNSSLYYKATLQEGAKQVEPVFLQFLGDEQKKKEEVTKAPITRPAKTESLSPPSLDRPKNVSTPTLTKNSYKD